MKISAASLFLAFTGFLQESKCMYSSFDNYVPPVSHQPTGNIDAKLDDGHDLTGTFIKVHQDAPWLKYGEHTYFEHYAVHVCEFFQGSHETTYKRQQPPGSVHRPESVFITLGDRKFRGEQIDGKVFHKYDEEAALTLHTVNRVYIGIQGTHEIWYASLVPANTQHNVVQTDKIVVSNNRFGSYVRHVQSGRNQQIL